MAKTSTSRGAAEALRKIARKHPDVEEDVACKGTAIESSVYRVGKKSFLFVRPQDARLKLEGSMPEARKLAAKEPGRFEVGKLGWVCVRAAAGMPLPVDLLGRWIEESYRISAGGAARRSGTSGESTTRSSARGEQGASSTRKRPRSRG
jgi:hypothetical protein